MLLTKCAYALNLERAYMTRPERLSRNTWLAAREDSPTAILSGIGQGRHSCSLSRVRDTSWEQHLLLINLIAIRELKSPNCYYSRWHLVLPRVQHQQIQSISLPTPTHHRKRKLPCRPSVMAQSSFQVDFCILCHSVKFPYYWNHNPHD